MNDCIENESGGEEGPATVADLEREKDGRVVMTTNHPLTVA